ncbi:MAG: YARHG domain-containing protein, partial [Myxococcota bacterium]|nr:YARHG domain-containing protein [Myxococcota bacterium]
YERALTPGDLADRSLRELSLMRNTIFARAGQHFSTPWLAAHFDKQPWYKATKTRDDTKITPVDWKNAAAIATHEVRLPRAWLQARAAEVVARFNSAASRESDEVEAKLLGSRLGRRVLPAKTGSGGDKAVKPTFRPFEEPSQLDRQIRKDEVADFSLRDLRLLRNMVFARRGYIFKSEILTEWFHTTDWYEPDEAYTAKRLTRLDWRNVKLIKSVEKAHGGPMTDMEHMAEEGWLGGA